MDDFSFVIFLIAIVSAGIGMTFLIRYLLSISKKYKNDDGKKDESSEIIDIFEKKEIPVTVVDMQCSAVVKGIKNPKAVNEFTVFFRCENNEILEFSVDEEMYFGFDIGMKGILTVSDNILYGFEPYN